MNKLHYIEKEFKNSKLRLYEVKPKHLFVSKYFGDWNGKYDNEVIEYEVYYFECPVEINEIELNLMNDLNRIISKRSFVKSIEVPSKYRVKACKYIYENFL